MSSILSLDAVKRIATLAKIKIDETKLDVYANQLNKILEQIQFLQSINTDGIAPMYNVCEAEQNMSLRHDIADDTTSAEDVTMHSHYSTQNYITVPKAIDYE